MPIEVTGPDGSSISFPDGTDAGVIHNVMSQHFGGGPQVSTGRAAGEGFLDTAGLGLRDEVYGLSKASGLPDWLGGFRSPVGLGELLVEKYRGQKGLTSLVTGDERGPVQREYEKYRDEARQLQKAAQEQHPTAYLGGQLGGAVVGGLAMPAAEAGEGAGMLARAGAAAKTGAMQGGIYGFGSGEGAQDSLTQGLIGAGTGAAIGGVASPLLDIAGFGAKQALKAGSGVYQAIRADLNPEFTTNEAARRILQAKADDAAARGLPVTDADRAMAQRAGIDLRTADLGGDRTLALARSAANQSPEARGYLQEGLAQPRFEQQTRRAADFVRSLTGGADATADVEAIREAARKANKPAYKAAYDAGDRVIWSPELERLTSSPDVQAAINSAGKSGQSRAVSEGMGGFRPGLQVTPDGRIEIPRGPKGAPNYPNIQFWDYVQRDLSDMAQSAKAEPDRFRYLSSLHKQLNAELDNIVPEFGQARGGAAQSFKSLDAIDQGREFATSTRDNAEFARDIARLSGPNKELFARGYASELAGRLLESGNSNDLLKRTFVTSPAAKERHLLALGPQRAQQLEAYLRVEGLTDRLRQAMGNSRTAEYLHQAGLAAGGGLGLLAGEHFGGEHGSLFGTMLGLGGAFLAHHVTATQRSVATEVGRLLASDDPRVFGRGVDVIARTPWIMNALRRAGDKLPAVARGAVQSQTQGLSQ